jgi:hypothetical protein
MKLLLLVLLFPLLALARPTNEPPRTDYETVAASQTDQALGPAGGKGDIIEYLVIIPGTTSPGAVLLEDGSETAFTVFTGGASSVGDLAPIVLPLGMRSRSGAWEVTTGANVTAVAVGRFK